LYVAADHLHTHLGEHTHNVNAHATENNDQIIPTSSSSSSATTTEGSAHFHETEFAARFNRNAEGLMLFPINVQASLNDIDLLGTAVSQINSGPIPELSGLGNSETGDLPTSQKLGIGFLLENVDISHVFKTQTGVWIPGRHYLYFKAFGSENQVNNTNVGLLSFSARLEQIRSFNDELNAA